MTIHPFRFIGRFAMLLLSVGLLIGCHDSSSDDGGESDGGDRGEGPAIASIQQTARALSLFAEGSQALHRSYTGDRPEAPSHRTTTATCPALHWKPAVRHLVLDYGAGCTGADGRTRSGRIEAGVTFEEPFTVAFEVAYAAFAVDGTRIDGVSRLRLGDPTSLTIEDGQITEGGESVAVDLAATLDPVREPAREGSWTWLLRGTGTVTSAASTAAFTIDDPLHLSDGCAYPAAGTMDVRYTDASAAETTVRVDFGDGACDAYAEVTANGYTRTISLDAPAS